MKKLMLLALILGLAVLPALAAEEQGEKGKKLKIDP